MPVVGWLSNRRLDVKRPFIESFRRGVANTGHVEGVWPSGAEIRDPTAQGSQYAFLRRTANAASNPMHVNFTY